MQLNEIAEPATFISKYFYTHKFQLYQEQRVTIYAQHKIKKKTLKNIVTDQLMAFSIAISTINVQRYVYQVVSYVFQQTIIS